MASIFAKIALGAGLTILNLGFVPGKGLRGGIVVIGIVVAAAFILHFAVP